MLSIARHRVRGLADCWVTLELVWHSHITAEQSNRHGILLLLPIRAGRERAQTSFWAHSYHISHLLCSSKAERSGEQRDERGDSRRQKNLGINWTLHALKSVNVNGDHFLLDQLFWTFHEEQTGNVRLSDAWFRCQEGHGQEKKAVSWVRRRFKTESTVNWQDTELSRILGTTVDDTVWRQYYCLEG